MQRCRVPLVAVLQIWGGVDNKDSTTPILSYTGKRALSTTAGKLSSNGTQHIIHALGVNFYGMYSEEQKTGIEILKSVWKDAYAQMSHLHAEDDKITDIAILPLSVGLFQGDVSLERIFDVMLAETVEAMHQYSWLNPTICIFDADEFSTMHKVIVNSKGIALLPSPSTEALFLSMEGMKKPMVSRRAVQNCDGLNFKAYGASLNQAQLGTVTAEKDLGVCAFGIELETGMNHQQFSYTALKAKAEFQVLKAGVFRVAVGGVYENLASAMPMNVQRFLTQLDMNPRDITRNSWLTDAVYVQNWQAGDVDFSAMMGGRFVYHEQLEAVPFFGMSAQCEGYAASVFMSEKEFALSLKLSD